MSGIIVLTHNGLPPSQGGKRIGYQAGDMLFHLSTKKVHSVSALMAEQKAAEAARLAKLLPVFSTLPFTNMWGDCISCGHRKNPTKQVKTDEGEKLLIVCTNCGQKMKDRFLR